jgi:uncharacterized protein (TIGR03435 family)
LVQAKTFGAIRTGGLPLSLHSFSLSLHNHRIYVDNNSDLKSNNLSMPKSTRALIASLFLLAFAQAVSAQAPAYTPAMTFDVASIRQSNPDPNGFAVRGGFSPADSSHFSLENNDLWNLILWAYPADSHRVEGLQRLPAELRHATFNVQARADETTDEKLANLPKDRRLLEQQHMLQVLMAERFHLKVHWETRDSATYDLVVAKKGKLQTTGAAPTADEVTWFAGHEIPPIYQRGGSLDGFEYIAHGATMSQIVEEFSTQFPIPIIDKTGLTGKYYFHLKTYQAASSDRAIDETNPWPPLETAIYDQLGLELVHSHGTVDYLIVDHAEMPTAN